MDKIDGAGPEHPARKAARMIRDLHLENIKLIDSGTVFLREGVDVSEELKRASQEQIVMCAVIMERADTMDASHWAPAELILADITSTIERSVQSGEVIASILPEIGDYGHDEN